MRTYIVPLLTLMMLGCPPPPPLTKDSDDTDTTGSDDTDMTGDDTDVDPSCIDTTPWTQPGELTTIPQIRSGGQHLPGDLLAVRGAVVIAIKAGSGFTVQDPCADEYAGIYVFTRGDFPDPAIGDVVTVIGEYTEYGGSANPNPQPSAALAEMVVGNSITDSIVTVTGTTTPPTPIPVSLADLQSSATAERLESMLVTLSAPCLLEVRNMGSALFYEIEVADLDTTTPTARIDNEFFSLSDSDPSISVGDTWESVTGALYFSFGAYKVGVRSLGDALGFVDGGGTCPTPTDTDTPGDTDTPDDTDVDTDPGACSGAGTITTIEAIRRNQSGFANGDVLHVCGAVVTAIGQSGFTIQAPGLTEYGGLYVYTARNYPNMPALGDNVDVIGQYEEYSGSGGTAPLQTLTELKVDPGSAGPNPQVGVTVTGGTETVTPLLVGLDDVQNMTSTEPLECMLVRLDEGAPLVALDTPVSGAPSFDEFHISVQGGGTQAEIDNEFFLLRTAIPTLDAGDTFCAFVGPVYFSFSEYKLAPRSLADVVGYTDGGGSCP